MLSYILYRQAVKNNDPHSLLFMIFTLPVDLLIAVAAIWWFS